MSGAACLEAALGRINELIYRINAPAMRLTLMAPGNRFRKRDALINLLAGNLRQIGAWCYRSWFDVSVLRVGRMTAFEHRLPAGVVRDTAIAVE